MYDWNGDGKRDGWDSHLEYQLSKDSYKSSGNGNRKSMVLGVIGVFILFGLICKSVPKTCMSENCSRNRVENSVYCRQHDPYYARINTYANNPAKSDTISNTGRSDYSDQSKEKESSASTSATAGAFSGSKNTYSSSSTLKEYSNSYDEGYDSIYDDEDYDEDRYDWDSDYADGVDDAMDELEW